MVATDIAQGGGLVEPLAAETGGARPPEQAACTKVLVGSVMAAALALPGVVLADAPPEKGFVALKYLNYQESQPGYKRVRVNSPALQVMAPMGTQWSLETTLVADDVSGASPRRHSDMSATSTASAMDDERLAGEVRLTYYRPRSSYALGLSHSLEHDYTSNGLSVGGTWSSDDNNTTWHLGVAAADDRIDPTNGGVLGTVTNQRKKSTEFLLGVTQAMSRVDIVQLNLTHARHSGYLNDPYKENDLRPDFRNQTAVLLRWNYRFVERGATLRSSYRYYLDTYDIRAHTAQMEWVQSFANGVQLTPMWRYYTQSKARFYSEAPYDPVATIGAENSFDQRLSSFGAVSLGLKVAYPWGQGWTLDGRAEFYRQRTDWAKSGSASTGLDPLSARIFQIGLRRTF